MKSFATSKLFAIIPVFLLCCIHARSQCNLTTNLALYKQAYASSLESSIYPASSAVDGDMTTRWSSAFSDPQSIYVDLGQSYNLCEVVLYWQNAYATAFTIDISSNASTWTTIYSVTGNTSQTNTIPLTGTARYVRMTGTARATGYGYSLYEFQVYGTAPTPTCTTNLALNQPTTTSSIQAANLAGSYAVDGNMGTRWSSASSDPQYIYVDLGAVFSLCSVTIYWEAAYGSNFDIDVSTDAVTWTTVQAVTGNTGLTDYFAVTANARYVRMYGLTRGTGYGYSIYEFQVMGNPVPLPLTFVSFTGQLDGVNDVLLKWSTVSEVNTDRFDVERSTDGITFNTIGTVEAAGNDADLSNYQYLDNSPQKGTNYYRLRQWDKNGYSTYSAVVLEDVEAATSTVQGLTLFPNPVGSYLNLSSPHGENILQVNIYSVSGSQVQQFNNPSSGSESVQMSCAGLPAGLYIVHVQTSKGTKALKMLKQ